MFYAKRPGISFDGCWIMAFFRMISNGGSIVFFPFQDLIEVLLNCFSIQIFELFLFVVHNADVSCVII